MNWNTLARTFIALCLTASVSGCYNPTPEQRAADLARFDQLNEGYLEFARKELTPLMPLCLASLESGQPIDAATMAKLGFEKAMLGNSFEHRRPRTTLNYGGNSAHADGRTTGFSGNGRSCGIYFKGLQGGREAAQVIDDLLKANGFALTNGVYVKGARRLQASGLMKYSTEAYGESYIWIEIRRL